MKAGWTLIEVMIATAIGALLASSLSVALYNALQVQQRVDEASSDYMRFFTFKQRFTQDVAGIFAPLIPEPEKKEPEKKEEAAKKQAAAQKTVPIKKPEPPEKVFYATEKNKLLDLITFITNNPIKVYPHAKNVQPKPRIARVIYRLEADERHPNSYKLTRQEGTVLSFKPYTEAQAPQRYTIMDGIKSLSMSYISEIEKKEEAGQQKQAEEKKEIVTHTQWTDPKERKEEKDKKLPLAPNYIEISVSLWDERYKRSTSFKFTAQRYSDLKISEPPKEKPKDDFESFQQRLKEQIKTKQEQKKNPNQRQAFNLRGVTP